MKNKTRDSDKIPPQSIETEERLLGEVITFSESMDTVASILSPEDFYKESHQKIFQAILELWSEGGGIDLSTVTNKLKKHKTLDDVGGAYAITLLTSDAITAARVEDHSLIIKEESIKRQYISYSIELTNKAYDESVGLETLISTSNEGLDKITDAIFKVGGSQTFKSVVNDVIEDYFRRKERAKSGDYTGVKTPLHDLNNITGGWQGGDLIIIAGRPSMGKTAFAVQCAKTSAKADCAIDFYTLEMTSLQLTQRLMACEGGIDIEKFRVGRMDEEGERMLEGMVNNLLKMRINLDDSSGITAEYIKSKSSANKRKGQCDVIIIDYLQLMSYNEKLNSNEGFGSITRKLKGLAKELNVPVILLSQLNRQLEMRGNKRPMLSDLRSSGEIEQDADLVIFPFREYYYSMADEDKDKVEIIVAKHRNGRTGVINAFVNDTITQFYDTREEDFVTGSPVF